MLGILLCDEVKVTQTAIALFLMVELAKEGSGGSVLVTTLPHSAMEAIMQNRDKYTVVVIARNPGSDPSNTIDTIRELFQYRYIPVLIIGPNPRQDDDLIEAIDGDFCERDLREKLAKITLRSREIRQLE